MAKRPRASKKTVDPALERQLAKGAERASVEAVFTLRTPAGGKETGPEAARKEVEKIVDEATSAAKVPPRRVSIFANVRSFAVWGSPEFVRCVLENPRIASAMANVQDEDLLIRPVKPKRAKKKK